MDARKFTKFACLTNWAKAKESLCFVVLVSFSLTQDWREKERENFFPYQSRENGRAGFYKFVSLYVRKISSEIRENWPQVKRRPIWGAEVYRCCGEYSFCVLATEYGKCGLSDQLLPNVCDSALQQQWWRENPLFYYSCIAVKPFEGNTSKRALRKTWYSILLPGLFRVRCKQI